MKIDLTDFEKLLNELFDDLSEKYSKASEKKPEEKKETPAVSAKTATAIPTMSALIKKLQEEVDALKKLEENNSLKDASVEKWVKALSEEVKKLDDRLSNLEIACECNNDCCCCDEDCCCGEDEEESLSIEDIEDLLESEGYDYYEADGALVIPLVEDFDLNNFAVNNSAAITLETIKRYLEGKKTYYNDHIRHLEKAIVSNAFSNHMEEITADLLNVTHGKIDMIDEIQKNIESYLAKIRRGYTVK